jgi:hypothetical protein
LVAEENDVQPSKPERNEGLGQNLWDETSRAERELAIRLESLARGMELAFGVPRGQA